MTILVVGGAGYVGAHVVRALAESGHRPVVLDNLSRGHREAVTALGGGIPLVEGELADAAVLRRVFGEWKIEAVMHFAAFAYVGESVEQPALYYRNNTAATSILLEEMVRAGIGLFIFSSTCAVYGTPVAVPIVEDHPCAPISPYGRSKRMVEVMLEDIAAQGQIRFVSLRYFNAAGASQDAVIGEHHAPETHLIPVCLEAAYGLRPFLSVMGAGYPTPDGTCIRDYVHVEDLASAHLLALERAPQRGGAFYNVGVGRGYSVREVIAAVEQVAARPVPRRDVAPRTGDPPQLVADSSRLQRDLGWRPRYTTIESIVATADRWFRARMLTTKTPRPGEPA